jgi:tRNA A37 threonylcarbamoyladenosine biosynthesis protein TsaE
MQEWLQDKSIYVVEWPRQSLDLNLNSCAATLPIHLTELERICRDMLAS